MLRSGVKNTQCRVNPTQDIDTDKDTESDRDKDTETEKDTDTEVCTVSDDTVCRGEDTRRAKEAWNSPGQRQVTKVTVVMVCSGTSLQGFLKNPIQDFMK